MRSLLLQLKEGVFLIWNIPGNMMRLVAGFSTHVLVFLAAEIHWIVFNGLDGVGLWSLESFSTFGRTPVVPVPYLRVVFFLRFGYCQSLSRVFFYTIYLLGVSCGSLCMRGCKKEYLVL